MPGSDDDGSGDECTGKTDTKTQARCTYWESKGYCVGMYEAYMAANCALTCCEWARGTEEAGGDNAIDGDDSGGNSGGTDNSGGGCAESGSVPLCRRSDGSAEPNSQCRDHVQCEDYKADYTGSYCCPYMKKCVTAGLSCYYPIANCSAATCTPTDATDYADWGKTSCSGLLEMPPPPDHAVLRDAPPPGTKFSGRVVAEVASHGSISTRPL